MVPWALLPSLGSLYVPWPGQQFFLGLKPLVRAAGRRDASPSKQSMSSGAFFVLLMRQWAPLGVVSVTEVQGYIAWRFSAPPPPLWHEDTEKEKGLGLWAFLSGEGY